MEQRLLHKAANDLHNYGIVLFTRLVNSFAATGTFILVKAGCETGHFFELCRKVRYAAVPQPVSYFAQR